MADAAAMAQVKPSAAVVTGVVLDPSDAVIPGAAVFLKVGDKDVAQYQTNSRGEFRFEAVAFGNYELHIERQGFATQRRDLSVGTAAPVPIRIVLPIAEVTQTLTVNEPGQEVSTEPSENLDSIRLGPEQIAELPVMNGDVVAAISQLLGPSALGAQGVSVIVDGVPTSEVRIPLSEIQQVTINNNPYSAEFARPGRARIEIITKSGSAKYHASASMVFRDYQLDARNAFASVRAPQQRRQLDANLSGPLDGSKRNTFSLALSRLDDSLEPNVYAFGLTGPILENASRRQSSTYVSGQYTGHLGENSPVSFRYTHFNWSDKGEGTGGFVLPGTGFDSTAAYHQVYSSLRATMSPNLVNELSFRLRTEDSASKSELPGVRKIIVLDAFTTGGAQVNTSSTDSRLELTENITWSHGRHLLKAGMNVPAFARLGSNTQSNFNGTFYFSSLNDYASGKPFSFIQQAGNGRLVFWQEQLGGFVQDSIKLLPRVSVAVGLRYDWQNYGSREGFPAPRLGFAWAPAKNQKTVIRGGAGIFYDMVPAATVADVLRLSGTRLREIQILQPGYPDPFFGSVSNAAIPPNLVRFSPDLKSPYNFQYSISIERQLRKKLIFTATWTAIRGVDLFRSRNINAPLPPLYLVSPDPSIRVLRQIESSGGLKSHSLQTTLRGNLTRFFSGMVIYEVGRAMTDTDGIGSFPANDWNTTGEWSRASFDTRHFLYLYGTFSAGKLFKLGLIFSAASGRPYNMVTGRDNYNDGLANARPPGIPRNSLQGSGAATLDVRWSKEVPLPGKKGLSLVTAVDAFNVFNNVNYSAFSGNLSSPFFGRPVAAGPARRMQLSLMVKF